MTFNQVRYFLEVARCLNFSVASQRLFMTQPALGRQITALERELNMQFFHRSTHGLRLTPAGVYLQKRWAEEILRFDDAIEQARKISQGYSGKLVLGILEGINVGIVLTDAISEFEKCYPNIKIQLRRYGFKELREQLYNQKLDGIITYAMDVKEFPDISYVNLMRFYPAWAVPLSNPLSQKKSVKCSDFENEELVITDEEDTPNGKQRVIHVCQKYGGFHPKLYIVDSVEETILCVETSNRCALLNMQLNIAKSDKVKMFPVEEDKNNDLFFALAWQKTNHNICLDLFRDMAGKIFENEK